MIWPERLPSAVEPFTAERMLEGLFAAYRTLGSSSVSK